MRLIFRVVALALALVWVAGHRGSESVAGEAPPDEKRIQRWLSWWMNEIGRQCVPTPQLLYICGQPSDTEVGRREPMDGRLNVTRSVTDLHPSNFGGQHEWYQEKAARLSTEAFVLPSAVWDIADEEFGAFVVPRDFEGHFPALCLRPLQGDGRFSFWLKNTRVPVTIRSSSFSEAQFENGDPLSLNLPKWQFDYAGDLRPFSYARDLMLKCPFLNLEHYCY